MVGITAYGAYIPRYRLGRDVFRQAWGMQYSPGERAVAYYDEDSITMAHAAAMDSLGAADATAIGALFLAATTLPYKEKQTASLIATAMDLPRTVRTGDFTDSLRAGAQAMNAALDAVRSGSVRKALVTAADCRMGLPTSAREQLFGDGAAAFVIGTEGVLAEFESAYSVNTEITDVWRRNRDPFVSGWEERWAILYGYLAPLREAVQGLLEKMGRTPKDFSRVILPAPDYRSHQELVRSLGFDPKTQAQDPLFGAVGASGTAHAPMMLAAALEEAKPGDRMLFAAYGNGADAFALRITEHIQTFKPVRGMAGHLKSKRPLGSYERFLRWRGLVEVEGSRRQQPFSSPTVLHREGGWLLPLKGSKCRRCGLIDFPPQRVCYQCGSKDEFDLIPLAKAGKVFTYTEDYLTGAAFEEFAGTVVLDLDGGGRFRALTSESEAGETRIDMPMELVFRNIHEGAGYNNYFWKARPVR